MSDTSIEHFLWKQAEVEEDKQDDKEKEGVGEDQNPDVSKTNASLVINLSRK